MEKKSKISFDFNYKITKFFLNNNRLTIFLFLLLLIGGIGSTFLLKTTGFPSPEVKIALIQTTYPGASAHIMMDDVTIPLESAIKEVSEVKRYSSTSANSFSNIVVTIDEKADINTTLNKINSSISATVLPDEASQPKVFQPNIGGTDVILGISSKNLEKSYLAQEEITNKILLLDQTSSVEALSPIEKKVSVKLDVLKAGSLGITTNDVVTAVKSINEAIPVTSNQTIDSSTATITTSLKIKSLDEFKNISLKSSQTNPFGPAPAPVKLQEIAEVKIDYGFLDDKNTDYAFKDKNDDNQLENFVYLNIKAVTNTDQAKYIEDIKNALNEIDSRFNVDFVGGDKTKLDNLENKVKVVEIFAANNSSQEQVQEVVGGLIGGPLDIDSPIKNIGWLLGGIQLVMLAMIAFVSWRAAIVAAAAIPLSLFFSSIYLYFIGETLNTLVLFSLVLVIGLVVDPALVILESIQTKVDSGLRGKEAVLAAVKSVGNGIFLAALTNIIVFVPFAILSGILGQIFAYIPLTIIPATIGSYIIPLVILAWLGGLILKPSKHKNGTEEENLWPFAKWLINLNKKILNSPRWARFLIILFTFVISASIAGFYVSSGQVKIVSFSSNDDVELLQLNGTFASGLSDQEKLLEQKKVLSIIIENPNVVDAFSNSDGLSYFINLKEDRDKKAIDIAKDINDEIANINKGQFFDIQADIARNGPPPGGYQVAIAINESDFSKLEKSSLEVAGQLNNLCINDSREVFLSENCSGEGEKKLIQKIDDGYTGKTERVIEIKLNKEEIQKNNLILPNAPASILINNQIAQSFKINNGKSVQNIDTTDGESLPIYVSTTSEVPKTLDEIKNFKVFSLDGKVVTLSQVAEINEVTSTNAINRFGGRIVGLVQARIVPEFADDQSIVGLATSTVVDFYSKDDSAKTIDLGLEKNAIEEFSDGSTADTFKSFQELLIALVLAIFVSYIVLSLFFGSFTQPLSIIYTIPLTFVGIFPGLAYIGGGQFGFLEIIGLIILVGIVENVAIFLIDTANQKIKEEDMSEKEAIALASGLRFRPVMMTSLTALASLAPLAIFSVFYRSIAVVIMFGILTSGIVSLITTPILFVFFKWLSKKFYALSSLLKLVVIATPLLGMVLFYFSDGNIALQILAGLLISSPIWAILYLAVTDKS